MVSLDVKALFTSILVGTALTVIKECLDELLEGEPLADSGLPCNEVIELLKVVLNHCVFMFQDVFYKQKHGAARVLHAHLLRPIFTWNILKSKPLVWNAP